MSVVPHKNLLTALVCGLFSAAFAAAPDGWTEGFSDEVRAKAEKENRCVLLLFTGSDWCPACRNLKNNVLETESFRRFAGKEVLPVWLDFPRNEKQDAAIRKANEELLDKILGENAAFPTTVLLDPKGKPLGKITGSMSADAYLACLREMKELPPAFLAVRENRKEDLLKLFTSGVPANSVTPVTRMPLLLYSVTEKASPEVVAAILDAGANPNQADVNGMTPLLAASDIGSESVVDLLLKAKADPNLGDRRGITPLALAVSNSDLKKVRRLVEAGASVEKPILGGRLTPLLLAARTGSRDVVRYLLKKGAAPNGHADPEGNTPLHYAAATNNAGVTWLLLQHKADAAKRNKAGKRPIDLTTDKEVRGILAKPSEKK